MGSCHITYTKDPCPGHTEPPDSPSRDQQVQQKASRRPAQRRLWCGCAVLLLLLSASVIAFDVVLTQHPGTWNYGPRGEARRTTALATAPVAAVATAAAAVVEAEASFFVAYPHEYRFVIDESEACARRRTFLVLVVPVAPRDRAARDVIRSTWGGERLVLGKNVSLFFLLGRPGGVGEEEVQEQVLKESREHRDLLQGDFLDCYKNLTIKTMVMMEWLDSRCSGASYAMKIDSDMFLNTQKLVSLLLSVPALNYMTGLVAGGAVVLRNPRSKWYLPVEVFPESHYPHYALGLGYVFSLDLPRKLVEASRHIRAVYIEDVYVGLCMRYLGVQPTNPPEPNLFHVSPVPYSRCAYSKLIATTTWPHADQAAAWKDFRRPGPLCHPEAAAQGEGGSTTM